MKREIRKNLPCYVNYARLRRERPALARFTARLGAAFLAALRFGAVLLAAARFGAAVVAPVRFAAVFLATLRLGAAFLAPVVAFLAALRLGAAFLAVLRLGEAFFVAFFLDAFFLGVLLSIPRKSNKSPVEKPRASFSSSVAWRSLVHSLPRQVCGASPPFLPALTCRFDTVIRAVVLFVIFIPFVLRVLLSFDVL